MSDLPDFGEDLAWLTRATASLHTLPHLDALDSAVADLVRRACGAEVALVVRVDADMTSWDRSVLDSQPAAVSAVATGLLDALAVGPGVDAQALVGVDDGAAVSVATDAGVVAAVLAIEPTSVDEAVRGSLTAIGEHVAAATARLWERRARQRGAERLREALDERVAVVDVLQRALLPPRLPVVPDVFLGATYRPLIEDIGGDFYEVFPMRDDSWGVVLGDVCGKGPEAASITALARNSVRTVVVDAPDPTRAARVLNRLLVEERADERSALCTAVVGRLDVRDGEIDLELAVAGHPSPVLLRADGGSETVAQTGPILGIWDTIDVGSSRVTLRPGDTCVLYTDGATDVLDAAGDEFGEERLHEVIEGCRGMHPATIAKAIEHAVVDFQEGRSQDDLAVLVIAAPAG